MADSDAVKQFESITGANSNTAKFFLGAARNDLDSAVNAFFEADGVIPAGALGTGTAASSSAAPAAAAPSAARPARRAVPSSVATLATLGDGEDEEDESGKNYYAGGEKSGQMIQDPRGRDGASGSGAGPASAGGDRQLAEAILERARQRMGSMDEEERERFGENQRFTGAGYRLGETGAEQDAPVRPAVVGRRNVTRSIAFYDNGFVVDEGPLRSYEDPANAAFLADVNKGVVPREMEEPGIGDVSITLLDKKGEKFESSKERIVPFSGGGHRLGAPSAAAAAAATAPVETATVVVDETRPVAVVQVRLSDGTRIRARFNEDHTVGELRAFVAATRPGITSFNLATTFPRLELTDDSLSIKDAGLKGAVVVQSLK